MLILRLEGGLVSFLTLRSGWASTLKLKLKSVPCAYSSFQWNSVYCCRCQFCLGLLPWSPQSLPCGFPYNSYEVLEILLWQRSLVRWWGIFSVRIFAMLASQQQHWVRGSWSANHQLVGQWYDCLCLVQPNACWLHLKWTTNQSKDVQASYSIHHCGNSKKMTSDRAEAEAINYLNSWMARIA